MGELHLEVSVERLRQENRLEIERKQQKVSYRESITKKLENVEAQYKKQSGGSGHFARIWINFEPNEGKGFEFVDKTSGQGMDKKKGEVEEVRKGLEEAMSFGLLLNYSLLDLKAILIKGQRHEVDTKPGDFKNAAILALRGDGMEERKKRIQELGVALLEPIMQVEIIVPRDYMGDVLADLGSRRAMIENTEEKEGAVYINGEIPLKEILSYSVTLRQLTKGRGEYSMHLIRYQKVPENVLEEILKEEKLRL
ncbi:5089_t:CDS:1 [Funneliformis geosporum]|uniref:5089_t:CDS:1 n=1 Tax=Funneliformis geosporum TaxID=1117311 RepID=A0A9W4SY06_9GLOM|nr:5089_t:CDS:1 [Funneliformis geosporum]